MNDNIFVYILSSYSNVIHFTHFKLKRLHPICLLFCTMFKCNLKSNPKKNTGTDRGNKYLIDIIMITLNTKK